jgi:multidrug resistance efflux pump
LKFASIQTSRVDTKANTGAQLNLSYTVINAPTGGVVAKVEQLQVGDTIAASAPRLSANVTVDTHAGDPTLTAETGPTSAGAVPR